MKKSTARSAQSEMLGSFLKARRERAGLTQKQVSDELGYTTAQFVSSWERGEREPPMHAIWRLASIYNISAEKIFDVMLEYRHKMIEQELRAEFLAVRPRTSKSR